jgi:hypothetical protein
MFDSNFEKIQLMIGALEARKVCEIEIIDSIHQIEFKVFSQWGDDGIIQWLIHKLQITQKTFIEFGVENYQESNTRFLLIHSGWKGLIMDGSTDNINYVKCKEFYWKYNLEAKAHFIDCENINDLIRSSGLSGEIGLLHIDLDGNDYWIWESLTVVKPVIIIVEYNSVFGHLRSISVPYDPSFSRTRKHYSNLYFGASLPAFCHLAGQKGYTLVGSNSAGNNAYFVRNDQMKSGIPTPSPREAYVCSMFRESRDHKGNLTFENGQKREETIKGLSVWNVITNTPEIF